MPEFENINTINKCLFHDWQWDKKDFEVKVVDKILTVTVKCTICGEKAFEQYKFVDIVDDLGQPKETKQ